MYDDDYEKHAHAIRCTMRAITTLIGRDYMSAEISKHLWAELVDLAADYVALKGSVIDD